MKKPGILLRLLLVFMKVGFFTFGGGYAMISLIEHLCVEREGWITHDEMMNVVVIAESTPGPIAINCATFVGYRQAGLSGALAATLGIVLPSFAVIYLIASRFDRFLAIRAVSSAFRGIKLSVGLLVLDAGIRMVRKMPALPFLLVVEVVEYRFLLAKRQQLGIRLVVVHLAVNGPLVLSAFLDRAELGRPP